MAGELIPALFNTSIRDLTKDDLISFFTPERQESDVLEFKAYIDEEKPGTDKNSRDKEKLEKILITICGFLNSDGGVLIWGAPKGKITPGPLLEEVSKETLVTEVVWISM